MDVESNTELREIMGAQVLRQAALVGEGGLYLSWIPSFLCRMRNHGQKYEDMNINIGTNGKV